LFEHFPAAYCCEFNQEIDLGTRSEIPLILNIKQIHINDKAISNKEPLAINFKSVARIGRNYTFLGKETDAPKIP